MHRWVVEGGTVMGKRIWIAVCAAAVLGVTAEGSLTSAAETKKADGTVRFEKISPARLTALAAMLPKTPQGVGRPIGDRAAWTRLAANPAAAEIIARAEKLLATPVQEQTDELYLDFSKTGNRKPWERVAFERRGRLTWWVMAEGLENKGRFLPALEKLIGELCGEKCWTMPAHDRKLTNFNGTYVDIDLASSALAWQLATLDWMLGDKLQPGTRKLIRAQAEKLVLGPCREAYEGTRRLNGWMLTTNNWNAVCLAGVTGAALGLVDSPQQRALFVAAAEHYSKNFLAGFTPDGYCSEGLGYWNYGFGHYVLLSETVRQATGGKLDLIVRPEVRAPARFGANIQIIGGVAPAFADCGVGSQPSPVTMWYVNRRLDLGLRTYDDLDLLRTMSYLFEAGLFAFDNSAAQTQPTSAALSTGLRTWFNDAGILIGRPAPQSGCRLGVALKGGHNAEHHNHNDVGSYVVVVGDNPVLLDPGAEVYTARTFSRDRYVSKLLNSFGHPVPRVAGELQRTGRDAQARVVKTEFTAAADTLVLEIASAYACKELKSLERTFVYRRDGSGSLTVTDRVAFSSPQAFETALVLRGTWTQRPDGRLLVLDREEGVVVAVQASAPYRLAAEEIHEDAGVQPTRIGIEMQQPVTTATVTMTITPLEWPAADKGGNLLRNGDFEWGGWGWGIPKDDLGQLSEEQAAGGKRSLKITDHDRKLGSSVTSQRISAGPDEKFVLRGKIRHQSGSGVGLYVRFYNAEGKLLNKHDARGNSPSLGVPRGAVGQWAAFEFPFTTPADTRWMTLWIHSGSTADVEAYLDDLEIVKLPAAAARP